MEDTGISFKQCVDCLECFNILDGPPQTLQEFCLCLKKMFVTNRIPWRDLDLRGLIAVIEKEPRRTEHLKETLRRIRVCGSPQASSLNHRDCFEKQISSAMSIASTQAWNPIIRDSTKAAFDHLSERKKLLSEFPPSLCGCACKTCCSPNYSTCSMDIFEASRQEFGQELRRVKLSRTERPAWMRREVNAELRANGQSPDENLLE